MTRHFQRLHNIGKYALPPKGTLERILLENRIHKNADKGVKEYAEKAFRIAKCKLAAQMNNGIGFSVDQNIRYYLNEFNGRNWTAGLRSMPASFNVMEAFFRYRASLQYFELCREKDHLCSFSDFLDFITSGEHDCSLRSIISKTEDGVIYSYNFKDALNGLTFSYEHESKYVITGVSIIRHDNEISMCMVTGIEANLQNETSLLKKEMPAAMKNSQILPDKEKLIPSSEWTIEAVPLDGTDNYWQTLVLARVDLRSETIEVKYICKDAGISFLVSTDDPQVFTNPISGEIDDPELKEILERDTKILNESHGLFEMCKVSLMLPLYFAHFDELVYEERHKTKLEDIFLKNPDLAKMEIKLNNNERIYSRRLSVLNRNLSNIPNLTLFHAPDLKVETSGFWKSLPLDAIGEDKYGHPIHGKTWVKQTLSWKETVENNAVSAHFISKQTTYNNNENDKTGYVYVMRCAAHDKNIFKIGITRKSTDIRAEELSRHTNSPDKFLVVNEWLVPNYTLAEKLIHDKLSEFRLNPKREFFQVDYKTIVRTITEIIESLTNK